MSKSEKPHSKSESITEKTEANSSAESSRAAREAEELAALQAEFLRAESARRRRALLGGLAVIGGIALLVVLGVVFQDTVFRPLIEVEKGEQEVFAETNDPVCRGLIARVTEIGASYFEQESSIERGLVSTDREEVLRIGELLENYRSRLAKAEQESADAVLRYDNSRDELDRWFAYVDTELGHLSRLASERASKLGGDSAEESAGQGGDEKLSEAAALDLQGRALLAVHESFQSFRVWHSAGLHPCGRSPEGSEKLEKEEN